MALTKPASRPVNPRFSSGPCAKPPTWTLDALADAPLGRSHRAGVGKAKLKEAIDIIRGYLEWTSAEYVPPERLELVRRARKLVKEERR